MARLSAPSRVAHERVEDEVIAINLDTGTYFSLRDSAADAWTLFMDGADLAGASEALAVAHGIGIAGVAADLEAFTDALVEAGLLTVDAGAALVVVALPAPPRAYATPVVERYDDMEELLLLDPIHEVDDAGWPVIPVEPT